MVNGKKPYKNYQVVANSGGEFKCLKMLDYFAQQHDTI